MRKKIKRRNAIEPIIGYMKGVGKMGRNWLKGAQGDAIHAVLCAAGYNIRLMMRKLRLFYAMILAFRQHMLLTQLFKNTQNNSKI
jgi:IS5 family transposase